jgi:polygalacturonase
MSIGSETYGSSTVAGTLIQGVQHVHVYDLTIDADSRAVGTGSVSADFNGIRIKSDESRGGVVDDITYEEVCMRDMVNAILVSTAYNPLFAGGSYPDFRHLTFQNVRHVTCMGLRQPIIKLSGYNSTLKPTIDLNNVIIDNLNPTVAVSSSFANINLGPGNVNFMPSGMNVTVNDQIDHANPSTPRSCQFPKLPTPTRPPDWLY